MAEPGPPINPTYFVNALADIERGEVAGYNQKRTGPFVELIPRISKADFDALCKLRLPEMPGILEGSLRRVVGLSEAARASYMRSHKAVLSEAGTPHERVIVVPRTVMGDDEVDLNADEPGIPEEKVDLSGRLKKKRYALHQLQGDASVVAKYKVSTRQSQTLARTAATNPAAAARSWEDLLNTLQTEVAVTVVPDSPMFDKKRAKAAVRLLAAGVPTAEVAVESLVIGRQLFMYGPGGEKGAAWHVSGSLEHAYEVRDLYRLVAHMGNIDVSVLLSLELAILSLQIAVDEDCRAPEVRYHVGSPSLTLPVETSERATSLMSVELRMAIAGLTDRLLPVCGEQGNPIATAVRVTGRHLLINTHVYDTDPLCTVEGAQIVAHKAIARDVWSVLHDGDSKPWKIRDVVVGELAVICYRSGDSVVCTSPVKVIKVEGLSVITTRVPEAVAGTSGGALVSLDDMALLGVHSAETNKNLLSYAFGPAQFTELLDGDEVSAVSRRSEDGTFGERAFTRLQKRGLGHVVQAAMASLVPLFCDGKHVGMAVRRGDKLCTTCDPELPLRIGPKRYVGVFDQIPGARQYTTGNTYPTLGAPVMTRRPEYFEKVFVIGYDDNDAYFSSETTVCHIGTAAKTFVLADIPGLDKPVQGGLVMAWDGAVVGQCGPRSASTPVGVGFSCWALPLLDRAHVVSPVGMLKQSFPFLNVEAWDKDVIEEVFTHSSVGTYSSGKPFNAGNRPLANVGDNVAKAELYKALRDAVVPHPEWARIMQRLQSNNNYAEKAWECGFAQGIVVGPGTDLPRESKAYADLTEALIGAVAVMELPEVVTRFCVALGIVYTAVPAISVLGASPME